MKFRFQVHTPQFLTQMKCKVAKEKQAPAFARRLLRCNLIRYPRRKTNLLIPPQIKVLGKSWARTGIWLKEPCACAPHVCRLRNVHCSSHSSVLQLQEWLHCPWTHNRRGRQGVPARCFPSPKISELLIIWIMQVIGFFVVLTGERKWPPWWTKMCNRNWLSAPDGLCHRTIKDCSWLWLQEGLSVILSYWHIFMYCSLKSLIRSPIPPWNLKF